MKLLLFLGALLFFLSPICFAEAPSLQDRFEKIEAVSAEYGAGGQAVLREAFATLSHRDYSQTGIEDLWAIALKEGKNLFDRQILWSSTGPLQTGDMLGQITIGPWQLTLTNARRYGKLYGIQPSWNDNQLVSFLREAPRIQASLAADYIEEAYRTHGRRTPYALQSYFWLDAFLQKRIGQGPWYASVIADKPDQRRLTGFYAKQLQLGSRFNPKGLLYWLYTTGDEEAILEILRSWAERGYPIGKEDLSHCACDAKFQSYLLERLNTESFTNLK